MVAALANINKVLETIFGPLDPAAEFRFYVEIDGLFEGAFIECSGMKAERDVVRFHEGGVNDVNHRLPGHITYSDITLRKGVMFSVELWDWFYKGSETGKVKKRDLTIIQYSSYFNIPARWYNVSDAFPVSWEASSLRTDSTQLAVESLTLTFSSFEVEDWTLLSLMAKMAL